MKKKKPKNLIFNHALNANREIAKDQGFYDGRFQVKVIRNKKKQADKTASRKFNFQKNSED